MQRRTGGLTWGAGLAGLALLMATIVPAAAQMRSPTTPEATPQAALEATPQAAGPVRADDGVGPAAGDDYDPWGEVEAPVFDWGGAALDDADREAVAESASDSTRDPGVDATADPDPNRFAAAEPDPDTSEPSALDLLRREQVRRAPNAPVPAMDAGWLGRVQASALSLLQRDSASNPPPESPATPVEDVPARETSGSDPDTRRVAVATIERAPKARAPRDSVVAAQRATEALPNGFVLSWFDGDQLEAAPFGRFMRVESDRFADGLDCARWAKQLVEDYGGGRFDGLRQPRHLTGVCHGPQPKDGIYTYYAHNGAITVQRPTGSEMLLSRELEYAYREALRPVRELATPYDATLPYWR